MLADLGKISKRYSCNLKFVMIVEFTLCLIVFALFRFVLVSGHIAQDLPPGPYRWPLIGNVVEMALADLKYPHKALGLMAKKYGDIMGLGFGVHYMGKRFHTKD